MVRNGQMIQLVGPLTDSNSLLAELAEVASHRLQIGRPLTRTGATDRRTFRTLATAFSVKLRRTLECLFAQFWAFSRTDLAPLYTFSFNLRVTHDSNGTCNSEKR